MNEEERLNEIIWIANKIGWVLPRENMPVTVSYPLMQLSEVEKCMLAMSNDLELDQMRKWADEVERQRR